tara:strand:+ start:76 stop:549 length:474 start_codon:yes stop_codon:yes gene_type:complete
MAGTASSWTNLGSNTNSAINTDTAEEANVNVINNGGVSSQIRHECHMWLIDDEKTATKTFNWAIDTDFTIVLNSAKTTLASDPGNVDIDVEGSVDGTNFIKMADVIVWAAGTSTIGQGVYDYEASGRMPFMRLTATGANDVDNSAKPIKINIFMHGI